MNKKYDTLNFLKVEGYVDGEFIKSEYWQTRGGLDKDYNIIEPVIEGEYIERFDNGQIKMQIEYKNGKRYNTYRWYKNGNKAIEHNKDTQILKEWTEEGLLTTSYSGEGKNFVDHLKGSK